MCYANLTSADLVPKNGRYIYRMNIMHSIVVELWFSTFDRFSSLNLLTGSLDHRCAKLCIVMKKLANTLATHSTKCGTTRILKNNKCNNDCQYVWLYFLFFLRGFVFLVEPVVPTQYDCY